MKMLVFYSDIRNPVFKYCKVILLGSGYFAYEQRGVELSSVETYLGLL